MAIFKIVTTLTSSRREKKNSVTNIKERNTTKQATHVLFLIVLVSSSVTPRACQPQVSMSFL